MASRPDIADPVLATLVLSAGCLHTAALYGDVRRTDLVRFLTAIVEDGLPGPALLRSPMQFVRYAALELQALSSRRRDSLLQILIGILAADLGAENSACDISDKKSRCVSY